MDLFQTVIVLMLVAILLVGIAQKINIPYPILLICGGILMGFIPELKEISFDPNLMLTVVLPPILFYAAYSISFREFKRNLTEIFSLALGLVFVTTLVIGLLFKWLFPDLPWALAFAFGAIISPPDAVAATVILRRFAIQTRLQSILEGESLVNDASGLVLYRFAVAALLSGSFSFVEASIEFVWVVIGGMIVGLFVGIFGNLLSSRLFDSVLAVVYSFTLPYIAYAIADYLHVSGVLAVVSAGVVGARLLTTHFHALTRILGWNSWGIVIIFLNCFVFVLIGSQLSSITKEMSLYQILIYSGYGLLFTLTMIVIRILWIYSIFTLRLYLANQSFHMKPKDVMRFKQATIAGWAGMRGIVSLIAALALPFYMAGGMPLPGRNIVIFMTFIVIFLTLMIPGLTLPTLIQWLDLPEEKDEKALDHARQQLIQAAEEEIHRLHTIKRIDKKQEDFLLTYFQARHRILEISNTSSMRSKIVEQARHQVLKRQRHYLMHLWERQEVNDRLFNLLERELDNEDGQHLAHGHLQ